MEISRKCIHFCLVLLFFELCNGFPINLEDSVADQHTQLITGLVAVLLTVCTVVFLAGCLCCPRKNGFKEFRDAPVIASSTNNLDHGHVNPIANGEFTIFTPLSAPHYNNNVFLANEQIITKTSEDYVYGDYDVSSWFSDKDFPRINLKYIKEIGKGWFGKVVEGAAKDLKGTDHTWKPVIVRILDSTATKKEKVLFLHDAEFYRCGPHPNMVSLIGKCLDTVPLLILQEFCPLGDIKGFLKTKQSDADNFLSSEHPLTWCCNLTSALKFLHSKNINHSDLAARNCQLTSNLTLKLGDYGLAPSKYTDDYYRGTPGVSVRWGAPESFACTLTTIQPNTPTTEGNVWSLGVTMWEICECGDQPYAVLTDDEVVSQVFGYPFVRLQRPKSHVLYMDYMFQLMQSCWTNAESRPSVVQIDLMLVDLLQVYKNTNQSNQQQIGDEFDKRWASLKPNITKKSDSIENSVTVDIEPEPKVVQMNKPLSPSLNNLHGSLDSLIDAKTYNLLKTTQKSNPNLMKYDIFTEFSFNSDSSDDTKPFKQGAKLDFNLSNTDNGLYHRTSSSSETEEEHWSKKVQRGAYTEKVRQKSKSVADLMVLTTVDYSESESETPFPSLDSRGGYRNVRLTPKNLDNSNLSFGSEGNLLDVQETFRDELKKLREERRDSLLFVPETRSQHNLSDVEVDNKEKVEVAFDETAFEGSQSLLMQELNTTENLKPAGQVYNVFNVTIDKFSPLRVNKTKLDNIINVNEDLSCVSCSSDVDSVTYRSAVENPLSESCSEANDGKSEEVLKLVEDSSKLSESKVKPFKNEESLTEIEMHSLKTGDSHTIENSNYKSIESDLNLLQDEANFVEKDINSLKEQVEPFENNLNSLEDKTNLVENYVNLLQEKTKLIEIVSDFLESEKKSIMFDANVLENKTKCTEATAPRTLSDSDLQNENLCKTPPVADISFDLGPDQQEMMPNSLTHVNVFSTSTPFALKPKITGSSPNGYLSLNVFDDPLEEEEALEFSSNFNIISDSGNLENEELNYSLETWNNFLVKTMDKQEDVENDNLFDSFTSLNNENEENVEENIPVNDEKKLNGTYSIALDDKFVVNKKENVENSQLNITKVISNENQTEAPNDVKNENLPKPDILEGTFTIDKKNVSTESLNRTFTIDIDKEEDGEDDTINETFIINDDSNDSLEQQNTSWESGEGWYLHPQTLEDISGEMEVSNTDSYVGFGIDDNLMAAIRNELICKLPQAQGAANEKLKELEENDQPERSEVFLKYNFYNPPLSPILEESYSEDYDELSEAQAAKPDYDSDSSVMCDEDEPEAMVPCEDALDAESQSVKSYEGNFKVPSHQHTLSQESCCSNDTLFNLDELTCAATETDKDWENSTKNKERFKEIQEERSSDLKEDSKKNFEKKLEEPTESFDETLEGNLVKNSFENSKEFRENQEKITTNKEEIEVIVTEIHNHEESTEKFVNTQEKLLKTEKLESNETVKIDDTVKKNDEENDLLQNNQIPEVTIVEKPEKIFVENKENHSKNVECVNKFLVTERQHVEDLEKPRVNLCNSLVFPKKHAAPLPSPEDKPWKQLPASLLCYDKIVSHSGPSLSQEKSKSGSNSNSVPESTEKILQTAESDYENLNVDLKTESGTDDQDYCDINVNAKETEGYEDITYENIENLNNTINEADYVNAKDNYIEDGEVEEPNEDIFGILTDIRFNGPNENQLMSTSFSESNDLNDEQDWDSGSDTRSSSSGEFIWKEGEHEESLKALRAAPQDEQAESKPPHDLSEETSDESDACSNSGSSCTDDEGDPPEFVPSAWDKFAIPSKSALRSPEKTLEKPKSEKKGVCFKKQKYHCIYEYPREPESPVLKSSDLWKPSNYCSAADWEFDVDTDMLTSLDQRDFSRKMNVSNMMHMDKSNNEDTEFYANGSSQPFDTMGGLSSQFFPGSSNWTAEGATPDSGVEDGVDGDSQRAAEIQQASDWKSKVTATRSEELGGLRHTRSKLKLDLPPSPSAFTSNKVFVVETPPEPVVREKPSFLTFGKSRFQVQQVVTSVDKNVSFEALPYKPLVEVKIENEVKAIDSSEKELVLEDGNYKSKVELVRGEASLLDSADEDSGIESSTRERKISNLA